MIYCMIPGNVDNSCTSPDFHISTIVTNTGLAQGNLAVYTCASGFENLSGLTQRICENATWSGASPTCDEIPTGNIM